MRFFLLPALIFIAAITLPAQSFTETNGFRGGELYNLQTVQNQLFALSLDGVIRSEDYGETWEIVYESEPGINFHYNTVNGRLTSNDDLIFYSYFDETGNDTDQKLMYSADSGTTWSEVNLPPDFYLGLQRMNDKFFYAWYNDDLRCIDLSAEDFVFTSYEEPIFFGKRRTVADSFLFLHSLDTIFYSTDNINWTYKDVPEDTEVVIGNKTKLALTDDDLYVVRGRNLFKSALTDTIYQVVDTTYNTLVIAAADDYIYRRLHAGNDVIEINNVTGEELVLENTRYSSFGSVAFTDSLGFSSVRPVDPVTEDNTGYNPVVRFTRFANQPQQSVHIHNDADREYTTALTVVNNELFNCNHRGLHRYDEDENLWTFVSTPVAPSLDSLDNLENFCLGFLADTYYIGTRYNVYGSTDLENWELVPGSWRGADFFLTEGSKIFAVSEGGATYSTDNGNSWQENDGVVYNEGGTFPQLTLLLPPALRNDTLIMYGSPEAIGEPGMIFSADDGHTWQHYYTPNQTEPGFISDDEVYFFDLYSANAGTLRFAKADVTQPVSTWDLEFVFEVPGFTPVTQLYDYNFFKSDNTLLFTAPGVGIFASLNDGETWTLFDNEPASLYVTAMAATEDYFYFASKQFGVRRIEREFLVSEIRNSPSVRVRCFPNPTTKTAVFTLENLTLQNGTFTLFDATGRTVQRMNFTDNTFRFNRSDLANGLYFYKISEGERLLTAGKIVLE